MYRYYTLRGFTPTIHRLDNEASESFLAVLDDLQVEYQMTPPNIHRQNPAERAIRTWKDHFMSVLATVDPAFPMHLWCRLTHAVNIQLNLLRQSRLHPQLSGKCHLNGVFDYNKTLMLPLGTKSIIYVPPKDGATWDFHSLEGWYLGPAMNHHRAHRIFVINTKAQGVSDTIAFFPKTNTNA